MRLTHGGAVWLMVVVTLMWGTAGVVTRHLTQAHSFEITFWRSLFTMLALLVILPLWRGRAVFSQLRSGGRELWISGVCWAVMFTAFMVALTMASTASVLVTMSLGPLLTALAARIFIGHRCPRAPGWRSWWPGWASAGCTARS
jgi:drug/metabolite transporter (DMT)-like permease